MRNEISASGRRCRKWISVVPCESMLVKSVPRCWGELILFAAFVCSSEGLTRYRLGRPPHQRVLFSQTRNRWRVMSNSLCRALSVSELSPRTSRWPRPTKAVCRADRHACIQHTLRDRFSTGKPCDLTLERWWPSGAGQHASHFRYRRETSTSTSSFARHERTDDVTPSDAVCDDV
jgi:hypothetical protein